MKKEVKEKMLLFLQAEIYKINKKIEDNRKSINQLAYENESLKRLRKPFTDLMQEAKK